MEQKKIISVAGMTCGSCESKIETTLAEIDGVKSVKASHSTGQVVVELNKEVDDTQLIHAINKNSKYHASMKDASGVAMDEYQSEVDSKPKESLYPLFLIVGYISLSVFLISLTNFKFEMYSFLYNSICLLFANFINVLHPEVISVYFNPNNSAISFGDLVLSFFLLVFRV